MKSDIVESSPNSRMEQEVYRSTYAVGWLVKPGFLPEGTSPDSAKVDAVRAGPEPPTGDVLLQTARRRLYAAEGIVSGGT